MMELYNSWHEETFSNSRQVNKALLMKIKYFISLLLFILIYLILFCRKYKQFQHIPLPQACIGEYGVFSYNTNMHMTLKFILRNRSIHTEKSINSVSMLSSVWFSLYRVNLIIKTNSFYRERELQHFKMLKLKIKVQPSVYRTLNTTMTTTSPLQYEKIIMSTYKLFLQKYLLITVNTRKGGTVLLFVIKVVILLAVKRLCLLR